MVGKIIKNSFKSLLGKVLSFPVEFLVGIIIARFLGPDDYGVFSFSTEYTFFFASLLGMGFSVYATREIAVNKENSKKVVGNLMLLKLLLNVVLYSLMCVSVHVYGLDTRIIYVTYFLGVASFLRTDITFFVGIFRGYEKIGYEGVLYVVYPVIDFLAVVFAILLTESDVLLAVSYARAIAFVPALLLCYRVLTNRIEAPIFNVETIQIGVFFKGVGPLAVSTVLFAILGRIGVFVIEIYESTNQVAYYGLSFRIAFLATFGLSVMFGAWMAELSRHDILGGKERLDLARDLYRFVFVLLVPILIVLLLLSKEIIVFVYGHQFLPAHLYLNYLVLAYALLYVSFCNKTLLECQGKQSTWMLALIIGAFVNVIGCFALVPALGGEGACQATLVGALVVFILSLKSLLGLGIHKDVMFAFLKNLLAGLFMCVSILFVKYYSWQFSIFVGGIVYLFALIKLEIISLKGLIKTFP